MKKAERFISSILLLIITLSNIATPVAYAAQIMPTQTQQNNSSNDSATFAPNPKFHLPDTGSVLGASTSVFAIGTQSIDAEQAGSLASAHKRIPAKMQKLEKKVFKTNEDILLAVVNPDNESFSTSVEDSTGKAVTVPITTSNNGTTTTVQISGSNNIKPGRYKVTITDADGNTTEQDFTWGVLALNTDKTLYHPGETADIAMAVLNDKGDMVCDAKVDLQISNQTLGVNDTLSTENKKIVINPQCQHHDFSLQPDYEAHYQFGKKGIYQFQLTALTQNGTHTITDSIQVTDNIPFDVQRVSATRIYPPNTYPMTFNIKANRDFSGTVTETVPESFTITPATGSATTASYDTMQTVYIDPNKDPQQSLQPLINGTDQLVMPFQGTYPITQGFGAELTDPILQAFYSHYGLGGHDGVDFGLPMGTPLYAVDEGDVVWAGPGDYGTMVTVQHSWGKSYYGHMNNTSVSVGQHVIKGQLIGYSGQSGEATGPHLHFGMKPNNPDMHNGYYGKIDPMPYLPFGHAPQAIGQSLSMSPQTTILGSSDSAQASNAASLTSTPEVASPSAQPSLTPTPEQATASPTPQITPTLGVQPIASGGANEHFTVLDSQIHMDEMLANNAQTEKVKIITWHVNLKKGDTTVLGYDYQTPRESPQFYLLGPVRFYANGSDRVVFAEQRQWQIAADDVGVEWYQDSGPKWNGYSWQYRKKIDIDHTKVTGLHTTSTPTFMESGTDATQDFNFYTSNVSCTSSTTVAETGPRSIKCTTDGSGNNANVQKNSVVSDAGTRISEYINLTDAPVTNQMTFLQTVNAGTTVLFKLAIKPSTNILNLENGPGTVLGSNGPAISTGIWYRIALVYTVTDTTHYSANVYVNGVLAISVTSTGAGTALAGTTGVNLTTGWTSTAASNANKTINVDDVYVDNGSDLTDPGDIHVTAKLPISDGASNPYTTNGSAAGTVCTSGTHCRYVNERPLNTSNFLSTTTNASRENFTIQSASAGDQSLTNTTIIGDSAWLYASVGTACTGSITNNGTDSNISLTTTNTLFTNLTSTSSYPSGNQAVGIVSCNTSQLNFYEGGMLIAYTPYTNATSLSNFPVLVSLTSDTNLSTNAQSTGADILFTDATGRNLLPFEIEKYSSGTLAAWVNVSSLSATADTIIYMYYGNPAATSKANATGTWNSSYSMVMHMPNGTTLSLSDSTSNANNGTNNGSIPATTGQIDGGASFNGSTQYISVANTSLFNVGANSFSAFFWVKPATTTTIVIADNLNSSASLGWLLYLGANSVGTCTGTNAICFYDDTNHDGEPSAYTTNVWSLVGITKYGTNVAFYSNGAALGSQPAVASIPNSTANAMIGGDNVLSLDFNGSMDETEYSSVALSPGWISTQFNNQNSPSTFYSVGSVETDIYAPTLSQLMRHGTWFDSTGTKQPFNF